MLGDVDRHAAKEGDRLKQRIPVFLDPGADVGAFQFDQIAGGKRFFNPLPKVPVGTDQW